MVVASAFGFGREDLGGNERHHKANAEPFQQVNEDNGQNGHHMKTAMPLSNIFLKLAGLANLYPTTKSTAARLPSGM